MFYNIGLSLPEEASNDEHKYDTQHNDKNIMLSIVLLNDVMLNGVMLNVRVSII